MCRRAVAILVILGWISLSGFDVIEDLVELAGLTAVSKSALERGAASKRGWGPLANNMVESAHRIQPFLTVFDLVPTIFGADPVPIFRKPVSLHKLHRVFLI